MLAQTVLQVFDNLKINLEYVLGSSKFVLQNKHDQQIKGRYEHESHF